MFRPRHRPPAHQSTAPAAIPSQHAACCKLAQVFPATPVQTAHPVLFSQIRPAASVMLAGPRPRGRRPKSIRAQPCRPHSRAHAVEYMIAHGRRQARRRRHFRIGRAANRRRCARLAHPNVRPARDASHRRARAHRMRLQLPLGPRGGHVCKQFCRRPWPRGAPGNASTGAAGRQRQAAAQAGDARYAAPPPPPRRHLTTHPPAL